MHIKWIMKKETVVFFPIVEIAPYLKHKIPFLKYHLKYVINM